jgi:hypothetical protein
MVLHMLSRREREVLNDLATFRDDFRRLGGVRSLRITEEEYVRGKLDDVYGSRYVLVLRNRIRKRASIALDDLLYLVTIDADDPIAGRSGPRSLLPDRFEYRLLEIIRAYRKRTDFRVSRQVETLMEDLQASADELQLIDAMGNGDITGLRE